MAGVMLLVMATGTGKTYTTFQIIWRLWKAGVVKRVLFLADRNILIDQALINDFRPFVFFQAQADFVTGCSRAHQGDNGGSVAGGYNPRSRDIWQDGLRIPPLKIYERGEKRRDVFDLVVANNRLAHWLGGDLDAMIGAPPAWHRPFSGWAK